MAHFIDIMRRLRWNHEHVRWVMNYVKRFRNPNPIWYQANKSIFYSLKSISELLRQLRIYVLLNCISLEIYKFRKMINLNRRWSVFNTGSVDPYSWSKENRYHGKSLANCVLPHLFLKFKVLWCIFVRDWNYLLKNYFFILYYTI